MGYYKILNIEFTLSLATYTIQSKALETPQFSRLDPSIQSVFNMNIEQT